MPPQITQTKKLPEHGSVDHDDWLKQNLVNQANMRRRIQMARDANDAAKHSFTRLKVQSVDGRAILNGRGRDLAEERRKAARMKELALRTNNWKALDERNQAVWQDSQSRLYMGALGGSGGNADALQLKIQQNTPADVSRARAQLMEKFLGLRIDRPDAIRLVGQLTPLEVNVTLLYWSEFLNEVVRPLQGNPPMDLLLGLIRRFAKKKAQGLPPSTVAGMGGNNAGGGPGGGPGAPGAAPGEGEDGGDGGDDGTDMGGAAAAGGEDDSWSQAGGPQYTQATLFNAGAPHVNAIPEPMQRQQQFEFAPSGEMGGPPAIWNPPKLMREESDFQDAMSELTEATPHYPGAPEFEADFQQDQRQSLDTGGYKANPDFPVFFTDANTAMVRRYSSMSGWSRKLSESEERDKINKYFRQTPALRDNPLRQRILETILCVDNHFRFRHEDDVLLAGDIDAAIIAMWLTLGKPKSAEEAETAPARIHELDTQAVDEANTVLGDENDNLIAELDKLGESDPEQEAEYNRLLDADTLPPPQPKDDDDDAKTFTSFETAHSATPEEELLLRRLEGTFIRNLTQVRAFKDTFKAWVEIPDYVRHGTVKRYVIPGGKAEEMEQVCDAILDVRPDYNTEQGQAAIITFCEASGVPKAPPREPVLATPVQSGNRKLQDPAVSIATKEAELWLEAYVSHRDKMTRTTPEKIWWHIKEYYNVNTDVEVRALAVAHRHIKLLELDDRQYDETDRWHQGSAILAALNTDTQLKDDYKRPKTQSELDYENNQRNQADLLRITADKAREKAKIVEANGRIIHAYDAYDPKPTHVTQNTYVFEGENPMHQKAGPQGDAEPAFVSRKAEPRMLMPPPQPEPETRLTVPAAQRTARDLGRATGQYITNAASAVSDFVSGATEAVSEGWTEVKDTNRVTDWHPNMPTGWTPFKWRGDKYAQFDESRDYFDSPDSLAWKCLHAYYTHFNKTLRNDGHAQDSYIIDTTEMIKAMYVPIPDWYACFRDYHNEQISQITTRLEHQYKRDVFRWAAVHAMHAELRDTSSNRRGIDVHRVKQRGLPKRGIAVTGASLRQLENLNGDLYGVGAVKDETYHPYLPQIQNPTEKQWDDGFNKFLDQLFDTSETSRKDKAFFQPIAQGTMPMDVEAVGDSRKRGVRDDDSAAPSVRSDAPKRIQAADLDAPAPRRVSKAQAAQPLAIANGDAEDIDTMDVDTLHSELGGYVWQQRDAKYLRATFPEHRKDTFPLNNPPTWDRTTTQGKLIRALKYARKYLDKGTADRRFYEYPEFAAIYANDPDKRTGEGDRYLRSNLSGKGLDTDADMRSSHSGGNNNIASRYLSIDERQLNRGVLAARYDKAKSHAYLIRPVPLSGKGVRVVRHLMTGGGLPKEYDALDGRERRVVQHMVHKLKMPVQVDAADMRDLFERFEVCRGEIQAGNDSPQVRRQLAELVSELHYYGHLSAASKKAILDKYC